MENLNQARISDILILIECSNAEYGMPIRGHMLDGCEYVDGFYQRKYINVNMPEGAILKLPNITVNLIRQK